MKRGTPEHPKTRRLAKLLNVPQYAACGLLECLWHFSARYAIAGDIGQWSDEEIAGGVYWQGDPAQLIDALVTSGWMDRDSACRLLVHDWHDHADESVRKTLRNRGLSFATLREKAPTVPTKPVTEESPLPTAAEEAPPEAPAAEDAAPKVHVPYEHILVTYRRFCVGAGLPDVKIITEARKKKLRVRWSEQAFRENVERIFAKAAGSRFLCGQNDRSWRASFDWIIENEKNYTKILEGNYDNREPVPGQPAAGVDFEQQRRAASAQRTNKAIEEAVAKAFKQGEQE